MREYNKEMKIRAQQLACDSQTPDNPSSVVVEPELTLLSSFSDSTRTGQGLSHDLTGLLLCPVEYDWEIPEVRAAVRALDPEFDFAGSARARCFYKNEECNPEDPDQGYLQSYLLVQVYRHLFTSPSSAKDQPENVENMPPNKKRKTTTTSHRGDVSQICQITRVTPRSIAYAAIHLHLALSDASHYTTTHNGYNYQDLWNFVVDFFEDVPDEEEQRRTKELLKWWNDRIFTGTRSAANSRGTKMTSRKQDLAKRQPVSSLDPSGHPDDHPPENSTSAGGRTVSGSSLLV
ncbi:hypothetical protein GYMLUDRAFT_51497 [Collybiopsis luxurians FD-317 M1]|uniref:Unplaced genomic scaffold GYMLUscaffold_237, whole genome shotgun sequence n=1 Tax=Collybiopsis luxurians FD-317 M1 TaxID=944289 RepID=A0A0D0B6Y6_9AGAR|nr:hypothetical protein GYMLUDRAFT_51497 [Collybiopsis luxurians FD-317 M1]